MPKRKARHRSGKSKPKPKKKFPLAFSLIIIAICVGIFYVWINLETPAPKVAEKIRILIVPGHEPSIGGTVFRDTNERDLVVEIGDSLKKLLETTGKYEVFITRSKTDWDPIFSNYFKTDWDEIISWKKGMKQTYTTMVSSGELQKPITNVRHNTVPPNQSIRLYGITKWVNENDMDLVVHLHINNDAEHWDNVAGTYSGFAIYVPQPGFTNAEKSRAIAEKVFKSLRKTNSVSTLGKESLGIVNESKLIAIGAYNSLKVPGILIEYGYIYEPKFANKTLRPKTIKTVSEETYIGIQNYFSKN